MFDYSTVQQRVYCCYLLSYYDPSSVYGNNNIPGTRCRLVSSTITVHTSLGHGCWSLTKRTWPGLEADWVTNSISQERTRDLQIVWNVRGPRNLSHYLLEGRFSNG